MQLTLQFSDRSNLLQLVQMVEAQLLLAVLPTSVASIFKICWHGAVITSPTHGKMHCKASGRSFYSMLGEATIYKIKLLRATIYLALC